MVSIYTLPLPPPPYPLPPVSPSLISRMVSVDVKHHVYLLTSPFTYLHVHLYLLFLLLVQISLLPLLLPTCMSIINFHFSAYVDIPFLNKQVLVLISLTSLLLLPTCICQSLPVVPPSWTNFTTSPSPTYLHVHHQLSFLSILYKQVLVLISLTE